MNVVWTDTARNNLRSIYRYIAQNSEAYAQRTIDRLTRRSEQISTFPLSGRIVPEFEVAEIRELLEHPYRIIYHIHLIELRS
jgi:addiction module RelE/StbE family toxin